MLKSCYKGWPALFLVVLCVEMPALRISGEPWVGEMGVSETTAAIMARASNYQRPPKQGWKTPKNRPRGRVNFENLLSDSVAPNTPVHPDNPGDPMFTGQTASLSFTGATLNDTLSFPPDSMGAAGPEQYIVAVNGRIRSFDKATGLADGVLDLNPDVFFSSVMTPPAEQNFTSDPRIRYDRLSGRWFVIIIDVPGQAGALPNRILIAVSGSSVITPSTPWTFFQFQHDLVLPRNNSDNGKFADYPTLGVDANALYIGVNIFATRGQGSFSSTTAFVVRKSSLLGAGPIVVSVFRKLVGNGLQGGPYTPQGVDNLDPDATEGYFIGVDSAYYGRLQLRRVTDPGGSPSLSDDITVTVPLNGNTINVPHLGNANGGGGYLDGLDYRLIAAQVRNGRLWTTANIAVDNTGSPSGSDTRMGIRWYELAGIESGQAPTLVQSGTLFHPSAANDTGQRHYWMGSVAVSGQGHALLGFTAAGASERINAGFAGRLAGDPLGTMRAPELYTTSASDYNPPSNPGGANGRRWGDYSYTCVDPDDDMTMWTIQEWCHAPDNYAVQIIKVLAPPPATPVSASPAFLSPGQSNVVVSIAGSSIDGSGFYDPGAGFSNRLTASLAGDGVLVNSVSYGNPTSLTLDLTVLPGAPAGLRHIQVTNPDGQTSTSTSGLLSISSGPTNQTPIIATVSDKLLTEQTELTFYVEAIDPENGALAYALEEGPPGVTIQMTNGLFSWIPDESQGPSTNLITIRVADNGVPPQTASGVFTVIVLESNLPPQLEPISSQIVHAGAVVISTNVASDPDLPANELVYSLLSGAPGASIDPATGLVSWPTALTNVGANELFTVEVADNGLPMLTTTQSFTVTVAPPPVIQSISRETNRTYLTWDSIPGQTYILQFQTNLVELNWMNLPPPVTATNLQTEALDPVSDSDYRFYRVRLAD